MERVPYPGSSERPVVKPTIEIWDFCLELAKEHDIAPIKVLNKLLGAGVAIANANKIGADVIARKGEMELNIEVFAKNTKKT